MAAKKAATKKASAPKEEAPKKAKANVEDQYNEMIKSADPKKGDKDPVIVSWCRENLSEDAFAAKYKGRGIEFTDARNNIITIQ